MRGVANVDNCGKGHPMTPENTYLKRDENYKGGVARKCRTCMRGRELVYRERKKEKVARG